MRLIDANALKEKFKDKEGDDFTAFHFYDAIDEMPTIEERKTGHWIIGYLFGCPVETKCSVCGIKRPGLVMSRYCGTCGSVMEGIKNERECDY